MSVDLSELRKFAVATNVELNAYNGGHWHCGANYDWTEFCSPDLIHELLDLLDEAEAVRLAGISGMMAVKQIQRFDLPRDSAGKPEQDDRGTFMYSEDVFAALNAFFVEISTKTNKKGFTEKPVNP